MATLIKGMITGITLARDSAAACRTVSTLMRGLGRQLRLGSALNRRRVNLLKSLPGPPAQAAVPADADGGELSPALPLPLKGKCEEVAVEIGPRAAVRGLGAGGGRWGWGVGGRGGGRTGGRWAAWRLQLVWERALRRRQERLH